MSLSFRIITATFGALLVIGILCMLGYWQVKRLAWKESIVAELETLYARDASKAPVHLSKLFQQTDSDLTLNSALHYGFVQGQFDFAKEIALEPKILHGIPGYHILTPLVTEEGYTILVNRGWSKDKALQTGESVSYKAIGIIRKPDWTSFTSQNSPAVDRWFRADIAEISRAKGLQRTIPYVLYAENISPALEGTVLQAEKWYPKNNHRSYVIFWFSMAVIACVFYGAFMRSQMGQKRD